MQDLFNTKSLTYLPKPNRGTLQLLKEFEQLQGTSERTEEQEARFKELLALEPVAHEIRVTFGTVSALQQAKYQGYIHQARAWFKEETDVESDDVFDDEIIDPASEDYQYYIRLISMGHAWASILASLRKYEVREHPLFATVISSEWTEKRIPAEWKSVGDFLGSVPQDLLTAMDVLTNEVNPNLWHVPQDETAKKFGAVSVS